LAVQRLHWNLPSSNSLPFMEGRVQEKHRFCLLQRSQKRWLVPSEAMLIVYLPLGSVPHELQLNLAPRHLSEQKNLFSAV
jgi:hypothetical protein